MPAIVAFYFSRVSFGTFKMAEGQQKKKKQRNKETKEQRNKL